LEYQWDYMIRSVKAREFDSASFEKSLQELGKLGWELFSVQNMAQSEKDSPVFTFFLKRQLRTEPQYPSLDSSKVQYVTPRPRQEQAAQSVMPQSRKALSSTEMASLYPTNPRTPVSPKAGASGVQEEEFKKVVHSFAPLLEQSLEKDEAVEKALNKNSKHGIALTQKRLILIKEESWGNPKVVYSAFDDIKAFDLREFFGKYDFSMTFFDRKNDVERIEVMSLEKEHIAALKDIVLTIQERQKESGQSVELQGILV